MRRIFFVMIFSVISLFLQINTIHAEVNPLIHPFKMEDKIIEGSAQPDEQLYVHAKEKFYFVKADGTGSFKIKLTEKVDHSEVTLYLKDKWGYNSNQITYTASDIPELPEIPSNDTVTFLGLTKDDEFYLSTSPGAVIYATYEGKVFSGKEQLRIPKGEATQIKAYAKSWNGVKNETVTIVTTSTAKIELEKFDYNNNLLKGKAWPYATIKFRSEEKEIATIQADDKGNFKMKWTPAIETMQKTNSISVEGVNIPLSIKNIAVIKSYVPTELTPFYMYQDSTLSITGVTFPDTHIKIDGSTCTISDFEGRFSCAIPMKNEPVRKISFQSNGKQIGLTYIEAEADISKFPFDLENPITSENSIFKGKTLPNRKFELKYNSQSVKLTSDESGNFSEIIPKNYSGTLSLNLVSENQKSVLLKSWTVKDERQLIKPDMKIINDNLILTNNMPDMRQLSGEIIIEHQNGEIDIEKLTFSSDYGYPYPYPFTSTVKNIQDGDRYILRVYTPQNDREARFEGVLHPIQKLALNSFKSTDEVITGTTEPYAEVELKTWAANRYFDDPAYFRGTANSEGKVSLKSSASRDSIIDLASTFEITIRRSQSLDILTYSQKVVDDSPAKIKVGIVKDTDDTIPIEADDFIKKLEVQYYKNDKLIKSYESNYYLKPFFNIYYDNEKHRKRFIDDEVNRVLIRTTNTSGLVSDWKEIKVLSTKIPNLFANEIYYGDKTLEVKTDANIKVKMISSKETLYVKSNELGYASFKLNYPITNKDYIRFIVSSEFGDSHTISKQPIGYQVEDIRMNNSKNKLWFVTKDVHLKLKNYELKLNGQVVKLQTTGSNPRSVFNLPKVAKLPLTVEITLRNSDGTIKSYYKKTIKDTYRNKTVSNIKTSTKNKMIEGIAQPYHQVDFIDQEKMNLTSVMLFENPKFNVKSNRSLKIGQTLTIVSKNPFGEKTTTQIKIKDDVSPKTPTVSKVTTKSKSVSGKTEGNAQVFISYYNKVYKTKADSKGIYRLPIQSWKYKEKVSVYAKDAAGNKSGIVTTTVQR